MALATNEDRLRGKYFVCRDGCWRWIRARQLWGYGTVWNGQKVVLAHRLAYEAWVGKIPEGLNVLHHCDNPRCINPNHLFLGTHQDNNDDMRAKGRGVYLRGEQVRTSKLRTKQVRQIKKLVGTLSDCEIARRFNVSDTLIWNIRKGISWRHV